MLAALILVWDSLVQLAADQQPKVNYGWIKSESDFGFEQLSSVGNSDHHSDCQLSQKQATNFAGCSDFKPIVWHIWPLISIQIFTLSLKNQWLQYHHCSKLLWIRFHWVDYLMKRHVSLYIYISYMLWVKGILRYQISLKPRYLPLPSQTRSGSIFAN